MAVVGAVRWSSHATCQQHCKVLPVPLCPQEDNSQVTEPRPPPQGGLRSHPLVEPQTQGGRVPGCPRELCALDPGWEERQAGEA